jgi:hypothetical protein
MKRLLVLTTTTLTFALAPPASAGEYSVKACFSDPRLGPAGNGSWYVDSPYTPYVATYSSCPGEGIVTRMSGGSGSAPYGASARHTFAAPGGTRIKNVKAKIKVNAEYGWYAGVVDDTPRWIWCGNSCTSWGQYWDFSFGVNSPRVFAQVTCGNGSGCPRSAQYGIIAMQDVEVTVGDDVAPSVAITGGSVTAPGWHRGNQDVGISSSDSAGIRAAEAHVGGVQRAAHTTRCDWAQARPCQDEAGVMPIPGSAFGSDGVHRVVVRVADAANNWSQVARDVYIDQTPPGQALDVRLEGGDSWRATNSFGLQWRNPPQAASPINAMHYAICPEDGQAGAPATCTVGTARGRGIASLRDLRVPRPGAWRLAVWLEDEAGNADRERSMPAGLLRFDNVPPEVGIAPQSSGDPTRVRVLASDATSGIADVAMEARKDGEDVWRSLITSRDGAGFSAVLDDSVMPKGRYELRARAVDHAGNERTTQREVNGDLATRTLPLRIATRLAVGSPRRIAARGANGKKRYRTVLRVRPRTGYGRTIPLRGRLTMPGANPLAGVDIEVWERVKLPSAAWRQVSVIRTSRTGRFRFKALRGPSRTLRFHYPGTATIRSRSAEVDLGVRAMTSFRPNRSSVVNGEEVRFHGRLMGTQTGATGKLLYLQVYTRGRWSTFATPRANRVTGLWSHAYRFSATRVSSAIASAS